MSESNEPTLTNLQAMQQPGADVQRLALRPREAARALGIGERLLWSMTNQKLIPHLKIGRAVVYPVDGLKRWLDTQTKTR
jgi:hypothetical protein